jgi:hypothetical protein
MEMAEESMEMALGAIPHPGRVPEHRLLSSEISLRWRWRCGTFQGWMPIPLGFSRQREFIGGRAMSEATQGGPHHLVARPGATRSTLWWASPWPDSVSAMDFVFVSGKIGRLAFVSSNSENISCVTFLKYKNSKK